MQATRTFQKGFCPSKLEPIIATVYFPDRLTDRWARRQVYAISAYARLIESDVLVISMQAYIADRSKQAASGRKNRLAQSGNKLLQWQNTYTVQA